MRIYDGKPVFNRETFNYSTAQSGDYVEQDVVDDAICCMPPACMTSACSQMGEPYSQREDPDTGELRLTYATFKRITSGRDGIWQYCGHCFRGETTERGKDPIHC